MVGPNYKPPSPHVATNWRAPDAPGLRPGSEPATLEAWWTVFADPILTNLVETAYRQNPTLLEAGARVFAARAQRGVAIGALFPQTQGALGGYSYQLLSTNAGGPNTLIGSDLRNFGDVTMGLEATWELDVFGRFRRGIEAADAELLASVASYDDVLVSLLARIASSYVQRRLLERRLAVVDSNLAVQRASYEIAEQRFRAGAVTELDVAQARTLLRNTEALRPLVEAGLDQTENDLSVLLGVPPSELTILAEGRGNIPVPPAEVAVGIPAELLRRRPDVRRSERALAAQSAQIGIATSDLYPRFSLTGVIELDAENAKDFFEGHSFQGVGGPSVRWAILNYGRIRNNIRVQDASYQAVVGAYEAAVLRAQQEVADALAAYLRNRRRVQQLSGAAEAAARAVDLADVQYREGAADYLRVLNAQQAKLSQDDALILTEGQVAIDLVALFRALGGGWEIREGRPFLSDEYRTEMARRTNWGDLLTEENTTANRDHGGSDVGDDSHSPSRWWPQW